MNQFNESAQPHLADFIQRYEEAEKIAEAYDDQDPLPLHDGPPHLHEPVKMTKAEVKVLQNRLYKIAYGA